MSRPFASFEEILDEADQEGARVSTLPAYSGDGYGYGGGVVVIIGQWAIPLGEGNFALKLGKEIAERWNAGRKALEASHD